MRRELSQKHVVSRCVADETTDQEASEALFSQLDLNSFYSSLEMTVWLQCLAHQSLVQRGSFLELTGNRPRLLPKSAARLLT
jgi:hypothetical protein